MTIPGIEFRKGISETLEQDSYFDANIRNLIVIDDQMIEAGNDNRVVNLFTKGYKFQCHLHCAKPVPLRQRQ